MYSYEKEKPFVFTDEGQRKFLEVRDKADKFLKLTGAFQMEKVLGCGSTWQSMACVDRLVELEEIMEITAKDTMGQYRVFIK